MSLLSLKGRKKFYIKQLLFMTELTKTSFLIIATIFTSAGAIGLASGDSTWGCIFLLLAVGTLAFRGWLKYKGIILKK